jgi:hypothetical protein
MLENSIVALRREKGVREVSEEAVRLVHAQEEVRLGLGVLWWYRPVMRL